MKPTRDIRIKAFIEELAGFAATAENTLSQIEQNLEGNKGLFSVFSSKMIAIRGTAEQLKLPHIANIAGLSEEIAVKGALAETRPQIRKCVGSLWDALTTIKYLLEHYAEPTNEEQNILVNRLEATLKAMGGARLSVDATEIDKLLKQRL